jgi:hypothetical protein
MPGPPNPSPQESRIGENRDGRHSDDDPENENHEYTACHCGILHDLIHLLTAMNVDS